MEGLTYCVDHGLHLPILETDSLVMKKIVEGGVGILLVYCGRSEEDKGDEGSFLCDISTCAERK